MAGGWSRRRFEGYEDSKAVLFETLLEEIRRNRSLTARGKDLLKSLHKRVDYLKAAKKLGGLAFNYVTGLPTGDQLEAILAAGKRFIESPADAISGADVKGFVTSLGGILKDPPPETLPEHVHQFRKEFEELIGESGIKQLIVLIDDLDRCLPETAIGTLEAIRLFLFVPKTAFVVAADEAMIEYAVRRHFPDLPASSGPQSYTRNYFEKLVQVPFRIPALGLAETRTYVTLLLVTLELTDEDAQKLIVAGREDLKRPWQSRGLDAAAVRNALGGQIGTRVQQALDISQLVGRMLFDGTRGNPRQIKRFLNSLLLRQEIAEARGFGSEINLPVLAKLMLAERFETGFYEDLAREVATTPDGKPPSIADAEGAKEGTKGTERSAAKDRDSARDEWIERWYALRPALASVDLRPYFFLTRDKRTFLGGLSGSDHLEELIDRLMGREVAVRTTGDAIKQLSPADAEVVFDEIRSRMMQSTDMDKRAPGGAHGLRELVRNQPSLQRRLLELLREWPAEKLGIWAAGHWTQCFTDPTLKTQYEQQLTQWEQSGNQQLKAAIIAGRKTGPRR